MSRNDKSNRVLAAMSGRVDSTVADDRVRVEFDEPQLAITPGQSVVFYRPDDVLGGGVIDG